MGVTSVTIGGLNVHDGTTYATSADTLTMLEAAAPLDAVMVDMAYRPPVYVRSQPQARPISLGVYLIRADALDRKDDYDALKAASDTSAGLVALTWTDEGGTHTFLVHRTNLLPTRWFARADAELVAPDPIAT